MGRTTRLVPVFAAVASLGLVAAEVTGARAEDFYKGKQIRLIAVPNLKKDCSLGPQPEVKVTTPPKNGALVQRAGKVKTPATYRCPNVEANVQAVFYESKAGFTGADEVTVEINQNVRARDVFVVQSTCAPTNDNLIELLIKIGRAHV